MEDNSRESAQFLNGLCASCDIDLSTNVTVSASRVSTLVGWAWPTVGRNILAAARFGRRRQSDRYGRRISVALRLSHAISSAKQTPEPPTSAAPERDRSGKWTAPETVQVKRTFDGVLSNRIACGVACSCRRTCWPRNRKCFTSWTSTAWNG